MVTRNYIGDATDSNRPVWGAVPQDRLIDLF
jgi:hypothetical protein